MIQVQLKNQTGRIDAPYVNLLTIETIALPASVVDGTTVALLTPEGDTLAIGHASGGQVTLDSNTLQAAGYCHGVAVGESRNAFLVIGETDLLLAIIPVLVRANPLDDLAPPAQMAPAYPTTAELHEILAKVQASAKAATEAATTAATETVEAVRVEMKAEIDRFEDVADAIDSDRRIIADYVDNKLPAAANKIAQDIDASATAAKNALTATATSATQTIAGQVSTATSAAENADGSAKAAAKARDDAEAAKGNAAESAREAQRIADNLGTVGTLTERVESVETSVGEKLPYFSPFLKRFFDVRVGNFKMRSVDVWIQLHEGFLMRDAYSTEKDRLLIPALNQVVQVDSVGAIRISVIEDNKTTIYSYSGSTLYKTTVSGSGEGLTFLRETITAMPTAVEALSNVVGYKTANGFIVCTKGHILSADLETEVATFYAVKTYKEIVKNGEEFYFYDGGVKKFATLTLADDGTPSVTHNNYTQTDATFFPITKTMYVKVSSVGVYLGSTADDYGYLYRESVTKGRLFGVIRFRALTSRFKQLLFLDGGLYFVDKADTADSAQNIFEVARGLYGDFEYKGSFRYVFGYDTKGNNLLSFLSYYNADDPNQYYYLLSAKEV